MTVEIAVLNRLAVALAADSTVTVSGPGVHKTFDVSEKLFGLSPGHPVGIMAFGNATFTGVPWETVVKTYRARLGSRSFPHLLDYSHDFVRYLQREAILCGKDQQAAAVAEGTAALLGRLCEQVEQLAQAQSDDPTSAEPGPLPVGPELEERLLTLVAELQEEANGQRRADGITSAFPSRFLRRYRTLIADSARSVWLAFCNEELSKAAVSRIVRLVGSCYGKHEMDVNPTGIVFAGFGEREHFPRCVTIVIEARVADRVKYRVELRAAIDIQNDAMIIPFAQDEAISTFIVGMPPAYRQMLADDLGNRLREFVGRLTGGAQLPGTRSERASATRTERAVVAMQEKFVDDLDELLDDGASRDILAAVAAQPIAELAQLAESLVNLAVLKQAVSLEQRTIGGPIDVAVISKGDGFVWVKRKRYV